MELFETESDYIILDGEFSLWCNRKTGKLTPKLGWDLAAAWNPSCLGIIYGVIGKVKIGDSNKLLLIKKRSSIGYLYGGHQVFSVNKIVVLPLSTKETPDLGIEPCEKHHFGIKPVTTPDDHGKVPPFQKTWNNFKSVTSAQMKTATAQVKTAAGQVAGKKRDLKDKEKFDKRVTEELVKMFSDNDSFYYSPTGDLTNSVQRYCLQQADVDLAKKCVWQRVDDRFFWNKHMLQELIEAEESEKDHWIVPMIQGFVDIEICHIDVQDNTQPENHLSINSQKMKLNTIGISLISRRSRFRAGTRYRRRGVDEMGKVANYVETEQVVEFNGHVLSFVQTRGSVPVFWSQPGYKYRPPPRLDRSEEDSNIAFEKHFHEELSIYEHVVAINLVDKAGRERVLSDTYFKHILNFDSPNMTYVAFDFHEYCRGMAFENVNVLIMSIEEIIKEINYCWRDKDGLVCKQNGAFRVNCVDCLDRTNVVQTALGRFVIEIQFSKLGVIPPEKLLPQSIRSTLQTMWANNGDSLSRQYAGTAALKGDFTRTGERGLTGVMKDSYTSANRYYMRLFKDYYRQASINLMLGVEPQIEECSREADEIIDKIRPSHEFIGNVLFGASSSSLVIDLVNEIPFGLEFQLAWATAAFYRYYMNRFKDAYRQVTIDLLLGNPLSEEDMGRSPEKESSDSDPYWCEHIKQLLEDCKKILVPEDELIMGAWAVIDADPDTGDPSEQDADIILVLTRDSYFVAEYDGDADRITRYQRVMLEDLEKIEIGQAPSLFRFKYYAIRLHYTVNGQTGYFHMFRSTNVRFFNNMVIAIKTDEEALESLKAICDTFMVALDVMSMKLPFHQGKLERRRSKMPFAQARTSLFGSMNLELPSLANLPRNISEGQLLALKNAGSKAISNVTSFLPSKFAKLNPLKTSFRKKETNHVKVGEINAQAKFHLASSDSDEEISVSFDLPKNEKDDDFMLDSCGIVANLSKVDVSHTSESSSLKNDFEEPTDKSNLHLKIINQNLPRFSQTLEQDTSAYARSRTPEIHISEEIDEEEVNQTEGDRGVLPLLRKLSHSSDDIDKHGSEPLVDLSLRSSSPNLTAAGSSCKTSHSEGEIGEFSEAGANIISPSKDLVMEFVKGVQSLGLNFQKATSGYSRVSADGSTEKYEELKQRRRQCRSRIFEL